MLDSAKRHLGRLVNGGLARCGWHLTRKTPVDLRSVTDDPIVGSYISPGRPFLIDVPVFRCRGLGVMGFQLGPDAAHPFVRTIRAYAAGNCAGFEGSPLAQYYSHFQPRSAATVLDFDCNSPFADLPPMAAMAPWVPCRPTTWLKAYQGTLERENRKSGAHLGADHGSHQFGPVSRAKGELELKRLAGIYEKLRQHGLRRHDLHDGDITGAILANDEDWTCQILTGQHRVAVLAALGYERLPIRFMHQLNEFVIHREDVNRWPQVRHGLFTHQQALSVFDRLMEGRPPAGAVPPEWEAASEST